MNLNRNALLQFTVFHLKSIYFQEAYVKALGRGFSGAPFKTFTIQNKGGGCFSPLENLNSEVRKFLFEIECEC